MNELAMQENLRAMAADAAKVRALAVEFYMPKEGTAESKDNERMAACGYAVEIVVSLVNIFTALQHPTSATTFLAITDLSTTLSTNPFWVRNGNSLAPLLIAAINGANDWREMSVAPEPVWDALCEQGRNLWLEMLPQILFLTWGQAIMRIRSVEIKKAFAGLLNG